MLQHRVFIFFVAVKIHTVGEAAHEVHHRLALGPDEGSGGYRPGGDVFIVTLGKIQPDGKAEFVRAQRHRRLKNRSIDMAAAERRPAFRLRANAENNDIFFRHSQLAQGDAHDKIGARADLADGDLLALEIGGFFDRWTADENVVELIAGGANDDQILRPLGPGGNDT